MKYIVIIVAATALSAGCSFSGHSDISGDWIAPMGTEALLIKFDDDGQWEWWDYKHSPPPKASTQSGKWRIKGNVLTLTVERSESCKIQPGLEIPFEVKEITPDSITVCDPKAGKRVFNWARKK